MKKSIAPNGTRELPSEALIRVSGFSVPLALLLSPSPDKAFVTAAAIANHLWGNFNRFWRTIGMMHIFTVSKEIARPPQKAKVHKKKKFPQITRPHVEYYLFVLRLKAVFLKLFHWTSTFKSKDTKITRP